MLMADTGNGDGLRSVLPLLLAALSAVVAAFPADRRKGIHGNERPARQKWIILLLHYIATVERTRSWT